ncbi:MAG: hypothetical protein GF331_17975 [Chitinivibrionales bacterium]|nr:hypothetical protein [Chitinivibrionales bacterium]
MTFVIGLLVTSVLVMLRVRAALILGIAISTIIAIPVGRWWGDAAEMNRGVSILVTWNGLMAAPDLSLLFRLDFVGSLRYSYWSVLRPAGVGPRYLVVRQRIAAIRGLF